MQPGGKPSFQVADNTLKNQMGFSNMDFTQAPDNHGNATATRNRQLQKHAGGQQFVIWGHKKCFQRAYTKTLLLIYKMSFS